MLVLLKDSERWPHIFQWFGEIPGVEIQEWLRRNQLSLPSDLIELWQTTGGGDIFESETILRPTVPSVPNNGFVTDDVEGFNDRHWAAGNSHGLYIFQRGSFLSAVRLSDQKFTTLTKDDAIDRCFNSLDEWYVNTIRMEFGPRYGLSRA
jgi:hypothetical protein